MNREDTKSGDDKRERTIQEYRRWLEQFEWDWFGTLKVTSGIPSVRRARQMFDSWVARLRQAEGAEDFRFFRVLERGTGGGNLHFHTLIGGLRNRRKSWEKRWNELGGEAMITPYNPREKGILYLFKSMGEDGDINCDFELPTEKEMGDANEDRPPRSRSTPTTIRVDRIDGLTTTAELKRVFKGFGRILEIAVLESRDGDRMALSAAITMDDLYAALEAVRLRDGWELRGLPIEVSILGE